MSLQRLCFLFYYHLVDEPIRFKKRNCNSFHKISITKNIWDIFTSLKFLNSRTYLHFLKCCANLLLFAIEESGIDPKILGGKLTESNFHFYDAVKHNKEIHRFGFGQFFTICYALFFVIWLLIGSFVSIKFK